MDPDTSLVIGLALAVLAIPAIVSALVDGRSPRAAAIVIIIAGGLTVFALNTKEGGYRFEDIPTVIYGVIGDLMN